VRAPAVRPQVQALHVLVDTLLRKESFGKREGMQLIAQMQAMLTTYRVETRRRTIFEELDRPHADTADLAASMQVVAQLLGADPRVQAWQAVIDDYAARFAAGPVPRNPSARR
jgi:hypothetical protein